MLAVAVTTTATMPAFAGRVHPVCTAKHHDCAKAPTIRPCCCRAQDNSSDQGRPIESNVQLPRPSMPVVADLFGVPDDLFRPFVRAYSAATRAASPDLPTLFASLLI